MRADPILHAAPDLRAFVRPKDFTSSIIIADHGLLLGAGTCLVRMALAHNLALEEDQERLLTLLSVAAERSVTADVLEPIAAAAEYWRRGERALANLRLVFASLPRLASSAASDNLCDAAALLDDGLPPRALMKALGFDITAFDKYDPNQPRVPAGSGRASGRWGDGTGEAGSGPATHPPTQRLPIVPVAADDPVIPSGEVVIPHDGVIDPLDPANLNTPLSPTEQLAIAEAVTMIRALKAGASENVRRLNSHPYKNLPDPETGAQLPLNNTYASYYVRQPGPVAGNARIIKGTVGITYYYTNNHYKSFYPVDIKE